MNEEEWITLPKFSNGFDRIPHGTWVRVKGKNMLVMEKNDNVHTVERYDTKTQVYMEDVMTVAFRKKRTTKIHYKILPPHPASDKRPHGKESFDQLQGNMDMNVGAILPFGVFEFRKKMLEALKNCSRNTKVLADEYASMGKEAKLEHERLNNQLKEETAHVDGSIVIQKLCLMIGNAYAKQYLKESFDFQSDGENLLNFMSQVLDQKIPQEVTNFGLKNESLYKNQMDSMKKVKMASDAIHQFSNVLTQEKKQEKLSTASKTTEAEEDKRKKRGVKTRREIDAVVSSDTGIIGKKFRFTKKCTNVNESNEKETGLAIEDNPTITRGTPRYARKIGEGGPQAPI